jgi:two-component system, cell cycle sensor histidine kinase and response regulator CckA
MRETDERLRQAIRAGNIGIFEHQHETGALYWSPELRRMYGWDEEEVATLPKILDHVHPEDVARVWAAVQAAHDPAGSGAFDIEHRIVDRSGRVRWLLTRSETQFEGLADTRSAVRTIGAVQDVSERKAAEQRLTVLNQAIASSLTGLALADASGVLLYANAEFVRIWGYSSDAQLLGVSLWQLLEPFSAAAVTEAVAQGAAFRGELAGKRATDGAALALDVSVQPLVDAQGQPANIVASIADVTERKRLESQLVHAQKIESIGRLAGGVAHDFNNLLTVIAGGLELGLADLPPGHPSREHLADVANAAQSAAALTRQLLAFSRKETIAPKVLDLNAVVRRVEKMILRLVGEDLTLSTKCAEDLALIRFDPAQIEQIIVNLAVNARDAITGVGHLTIETSNVHLDAAYAGRHVDAQAGDYVLLTVSDDGAGMNEHVRAHLFEPFFTTKDAGSGTGLGLAMVHGAVQQNGGRIEVYSEPGQGTTFKIYLPAQTALIESAKPSANTARGRATSVLLVEDDARVRMFAQTVLTRLGHTVHAFPNGEAALAAASSLSPVPELLMTDVIMPGMNGRVLAERIAAILPSIRVLFASGYTQDVIVNLRPNRFKSDFLPKPYSVEQLARRVAGLVE